MILGSRILEDGREITLIQMLFNLRLAIGIPNTLVYDDAWCFHDAEAAWHALETWDGIGHPAGWYKHVGSQTYNREEQTA